MLIKRWLDQFWCGLFKLGLGHKRGKLCLSGVMRSFLSLFFLANFPLSYHLIHGWAQIILTSRNLHLIQKEQIVKTSKLSVTGENIGS